MNEKLWVAAGTAVFLVLLSFTSIPKDNLSLINSITMLVLGYYFGSSAKEKDNEKVDTSVPPPV